MQVVSGPIGQEKVHYETPPAERLPDEMERFLAWFENPGDTVIIQVIHHESWIRVPATYDL